MALASPDPASAWWRRFGPFAWPTLALAIAVAGLFATVVCLALAGVIPLWLAMGLNVVIAYVAFTPGHDAIHGAVAGERRELRWVNQAVGWTMFAILNIPYPFLRLLHLEHHAHTNDAARDPDHFVAAPSAGRAALRCILIQLSYAKKFLALPKPVRAAALHARGILIWNLVALPLSGVAIWAGFLVELLMLWMIPAALALWVLAFVFDWLPHHPHASNERYLDTRVQLFPGLNALLLGQNYHLVHHLYPAVPFYRYAKAFRSIRPELEAHGSPIEDLRWWR